MARIQPEYFTAYSSLKMARDAQGVLVVEFHSKGEPLTFTARDHTEFVDAFYRISQDRANTVVILTGTGGQFITGIDFASFGNVAEPAVWSQVHDEGVQILENLLNIRVPVIAAVEGRLDVHSEYALLANAIVAGEGATFNDIPHFAGGIVPGDGIFTAWSYRAGAGRAEAFLLNPRPLSARTAYDWGVVTEVVRDGDALSRALELAHLYLKVPEVTRRNTRIHFTQPLKERIGTGSRVRAVAGGRVGRRPREVDAGSDQRLMSPLLKGDQQIGLRHIRRRTCCADRYTRGCGDAAGVHGRSQGSGTGRFEQGW